MMTFGKMNTCTHPIILVQKLNLNGKKLGNLVLHDQEVVSVDLGAMQHAGVHFIYVADRVWLCSTW